MLFEPLRAHSVILSRGKKFLLALFLIRLAFWQSFLSDSLKEMLNGI